MKDISEECTYLALAFGRSRGRLDGRLFLGLFLIFFVDILVGNHGWELVAYAALPGRRFGWQL
jgi:hypothetical protein